MALITIDIHRCLGRSEVKVSQFLKVDCGCKSQLKAIDVCPQNCRFEAEFNLVTIEIRCFRFLTEILAEAGSEPNSTLKSIDFGVAPSQAMLLHMLEIRHTKSPDSRW